MHHSNSNYNKKLQPFAHTLRSEMTKAEACLWKYVLKARQMKGYQFRRQRPVLEFIADFMCPELKLVIEVDGFTHLFEETAVKDDKKQKALEAAGFTVLRFKDADVLNEISKVAEVIRWKIEEFEKKYEGE